jgi:MerR family mercuric resistance operon transcriptional regulator
MTGSPGIQIGELSRQTGCNIETIRYYERIALLPVPDRNSGRFRIYDITDVRRVAFIRRARGLGFTLGRCVTAEQLGVSVLTLSEEVRPHVDALRWHWAQSGARAV